MLQAADSECQDRAEVITRDDRTVLVLADGAGGISGGAQAAETFIRLVRDAALRLKTAEDCAKLLIEIDQQLVRRNDCGETTGIITIVDSKTIFGASVGDSAAWLFTNDGNGELTRGQPFKPFLGSGNAANPRAFSWAVENGTIVAASDGLWKHTSIESIQSRLRSRGDTDLALRLAELVRSRSGVFPDDVSIVTCRIDLNESAS